MSESAEWSSPSNIALVKYWGKHGNQLPANASLSMSLNTSVTRTVLTVDGAGKTPGLEFYFGGELAPDFGHNISSFIGKIDNIYPFLKNNFIKIESWNTFPHSAGIASSASAMSALALCIVDIAGDYDPLKKDNTAFFRKVSEISRLGSGSASRSVYGGFSVWGKTPLLAGSSDEWAVPLNLPVDKVFSQLRDSVLIVSSAKKKISSSAGHQLMEHHPYASRRYALAEENLKILLDALRTGNTADFARITENEALGLHALMMSSDPGFMLIEPATIQIINKIRDFREKTGKFLCFTLDAGPNVHLLYPDSDGNEIAEFIKQELTVYCEGEKVLWDECGKGPMKLN